MESGQKVVCLLELATDCCRGLAADLGGFTKPIFLSGAIPARWRGRRENFFFFFFPTAEF